MNNYVAASAATFVRFELTDFNGFEGRVPVRYVKEWVWPKDKEVSWNNASPVFKTVRISEHKWPLHKSTYMCDNKPDIDAKNDGWPTWEPIEPIGLVAKGFLIPWEEYPVCKGEPVLRLDEKALNTHSQHKVLGNPLPNDGLPDDYLEFWLAERGTNA